MKAISVHVSEGDYEAFRRAARRRGAPIAQLIREAMAMYRTERIDDHPPLRTLPVLVGHRPLAPLPTREALYDEIFERGAGEGEDDRGEPLGGGELARDGERSGADA